MPCSNDMCVHTRSAGKPRCYPFDRRSILIDSNRKKFPTAFALTKHLRSPTHTAGHIACIGCNKSFASVASLIGHMETATKCSIRGTDSFRRVLGQITGGILDYHIRSGIFVIDQSAVQELFSLRSDSMTWPKKKSIKDFGAFAPTKPQHCEAIDNPW